MTQDSLLGPKDIATLREEAAGCTACDLYREATQTVFGEGEGAHVRMVMVGEQPGDQEDVQGRPFVGPAGGVLDRALEEAGIDRAQTYVTNTVKHFKWEARGTRRLHVKPSASEVQACRGWLLAELSAIKPTMIVCLGAVAAQSFLGRTFSITRSRGLVIGNTPWAPWMMATYHPSALLRMPDEATREAALEHFTADLRRASETLAGLKASRAS